jgi:hypothetical protein
MSLLAPEVHQFDAYPDLIQLEEPDPPTPLLQQSDLSDKEDNGPTSKGKQQASNSTSEEANPDLATIRHTRIGEWPKLTHTIIIQTDLLKLIQLPPKQLKVEGQ